MWFIGASFKEILIGIAVRVLIIFGILPIHEYAHAKAAYGLGDSTAKNNGRLTLNPLAHVDWMGAVCIMLIGFGWAKPVPVNPYNFRTNKKKLGTAWVSFAGPLSNLIVAVVGMLLFRFVLCFRGVWLNDQVFTGVNYAFQSLVLINIGLAVFNLIPIPPLDGSKIFALFIPNKFLYKIQNFLSKYQFVVAIAFIVLIYSGVLDGPLGKLEAGIFNGLFDGADWLFNLVGLTLGKIG